MIAANRKLIGVVVMALFAAAMVFGTVGSLLEVIEATSAPIPADGEYVARLATGDGDNGAIAALKYVCPFH